MSVPIRHDHVVDVQCLARTYGLCYHSNDLQAFHAEVVERRKHITDKTAMAELDRTINLLQQLVQQH
jgi:hypothetical protein